MRLASLLLNLSLSLRKGHNGDLAIKHVSERCARPRFFCPYPCPVDDFGSVGGLRARLFEQPHCPYCSVSKQSVEAIADHIRRQH